MDIIKFVKCASFVAHSQCVCPVAGAPVAVENLPVGGRLHQFWEIWAKLGASPRSVKLLQEGYVLPFKMRPTLTRLPLVKSGYANAPRQAHLVDALHALADKAAVEVVRKPDSLGFYNRFFLVPKPNNRLRPVIDLSVLNLSLNIPTFKIHTKK